MMKKTLEMRQRRMRPIDPELTDMMMKTMRMAVEAGTPMTLLKLQMLPQNAAAALAAPTAQARPC
jgi:hypothetical protein